MANMKLVRITALERGPDGKLKPFGGVGCGFKFDSKGECEVILDMDEGSHDVFRLRNAGSTLTGCNYEILGDAPEESNDGEEVQGEPDAQAEENEDGASDDEEDGEENAGGGDDAD